ncbi:hypothetical protein Q2356_25720, partial [Escherichia coli]|nr:hypothetical protein [Escherichia coli]
RRTRRQGIERSRVTHKKDTKDASDDQPLTSGYINGGAVRMGDKPTVTDSVQDVHNAKRNTATPTMLLMIRNLPETNIIQAVDR